MKRILAAALAALALVGCNQRAVETAERAPPPPVSADVESFNEAQQADIRAVVRDYLVRDPTVLREALDALAARAEEERETEIAEDPRSFSIGPADAPVTLVEFFDYRCPYCHAAMDWVFHVVRTRRDVRVVFKEFPVLGPQSVEASRAAIASIKQGRYQQFHRALMSHRGDLTSDAIDTLARQQGVDVARMRRDMDSDEITAILQRNRELGAEANVTGTPAFMINGEWVSGFSHPDDLNAALRAAAEAARTRPRSNPQEG
ncbi:MAG: DsbA family protein [Hyphomonadaceae bacterium]